MALFLLCPNLGWIQGQFNFTELSLRYLVTAPFDLIPHHCVMVKIREGKLSDERSKTT